LTRGTRIETEIKKHLTPRPQTTKEEKKAESLGQNHEEKRGGDRKTKQEDYF
jgi:hypothetical protein